MLRTVPRPVAAAAALLLATVFMVINPPLASAAPVIPTVGCDSSPSLFNTGVDAAGTGKLSSGASDRNWETSQQYPKTSPTGATPYPPTNPVYVSARVGNAAPGAWVASPYGNAEWIGGTHSTDGDWYYRYRFNLDPSALPSSLSVSLDFFADNSVVQIWVNDVAQSTKTSGLPQTTGDPYYYVGFQSGRGANTVLNNDWRAGANTIVVLIKSGPGAQGFDVQARPSVLCPTPGITAVQTVSPSVVSTVGQVISFSTLMTNTGNISMSAVAVAVSGFTGTGPAPTYSCPSSTLAAGVSQTCTASYTVRAGDLARTSIAATATGSGLGLGLTTRTSSTADTDTVTIYTPSVVYDRGATAYVNTPLTTIAGTSDATVGSPVTVTVGGQTLTTTVGSDRRWSVSPTTLVDATYAVSTRIVDTATNAVGVGTQSLTVDTVAPSVAINGGATASAVTATPTITGTTGEPAGTPVTVTVDGTNYPTTVQPGGVWSVTLARTADGPHTVVATVVDLAGNSSIALQTLTIDTVAPTVTIDGPPSVSVGSGNFTLSGTTDAAVGTVVTVRVGESTATTTVTTGGFWSLPVTGAPDAVYPITVSVADPAGNIGTATKTVTVDTAAPPVTIDGGGSRLVASTTPAITGTSEYAAGTAVSVTVAGQTLPAVVQPDGSWSVTPTTPLTQGPHDVVATATDAAGNSNSVSQTLTVDTVAPLVSFIAGDALLTRSPTPALTGTTDLPVDATVTVIVGGQTLTVVVGAGGQWSVTPGSLVDGTYPAVVTAVDQAGNTSTDTLSLTVDTTAPTVTIDGGAAVLTGTGTPTVTGTTDLPSGTSITVTVGGVPYPVEVGEGGTWSLPLTLTDGRYPVIATVTDAAGNTTVSSTQTLEVDTTPPTLAYDSGAVRITRSSTPTISGITDADAGATVSVVVGGQPLTATVDDLGHWSVTPARLTDGTYTVVASVSDAAGNVTTVEQQLTVDTVAPTLAFDAGVSALVGTHTPALTGTTDAPAESVVTVVVAGQTLVAVVTAGHTWSVIPTTLPDGTYPVTATVGDAAGNTTTVALSLTVDTTAPTLTVSGGPEPAVRTSTPTISGFTDAPAGTVVTVTVDGTGYPATVTETGTWAVTLPTTPDGTHAVSVAVTDAAGNTATRTQSLTVDTVAPVVTVTSPAVVPGSTTPITGTTDAPVGTVVTVAVGVQTLTTVVGEGGTWSVTPTVTVADGNHPVTVTVADRAGNVGSVVVSRVVDTIAPVGTVDDIGPISDPTPVLTGGTDLPPGTVVTVTVGGQELTAVVGENGTWSVSVEEPLADGEHLVTAVFVDAAGNSTTVTGTLTVDTTAPANPFRDGDAYSVAEAAAAISGTGEPGSTISVSFGGQTLTAVVGPDGRWSVRPSAVPDRTYAMVVRATDAAGNTSTSTVSVTVDTTAPVLSLSGGGTATSTTATPTVRGTTDAPAGSVVTVRVAGYTLTTVVGADGTWSVAVPALPNGTFTVATTVADAAGNITESTQTLTVQVLAETGTDTPAVVVPPFAGTPVSTVVDLAYTGSDPAATLVAAGLLLMLGSGLVVATRRRRSGRRA